MLELTIIQKLSIWVTPVLLAITLHEVAHGWMARRFGDNTAFMLGRLSLNPFKHIDPVGTILVPAVMLLMQLPAFGWAKPVPVNFQNLRDPKRDMVYVAAAGPLANLAMILMWALIVRLGTLLIPSGAWFSMPMVYMGCAGIFINTLLMVLNLLPLPPLDGGRVVTGLLPGALAWKFGRVEPYGVWILIALMVTGLLFWLLSPMLSFVIAAVSPITGLSPRGMDGVIRALM